MKTARSSIRGWDEVISEVPRRLVRVSEVRPAFERMAIASCAVRN